MTGFVERTAGDADETAIVRHAAPPGAFCNIRPHAVSGANQLFSNGIAGKQAPLDHSVPI